MVCCETQTAAVSRTPAGPKSLLPKPGECGIQSSNRIVNGGLTLIDEFPWMALLQYRSQYGQVAFACGGALINQRYVLTAAHCINVGDWTLFSVRLGEWDVESEVDCTDGDCSDPPMDVPIEQKFQHERYSASNPQTHNDIALLRLSRAVKFSYFVKPICLPVEPHLRASVMPSYAGHDFDVAGWGKTEYGVKSRYKLAVQVAGQNNAVCTAAYSVYQIIDSQVCAGGGSKYLS